jgi:hypothetical protein
LLRGITDELGRLKLGGLSWRRKILTATGPGSQESRFGADFLGVLSVDLPDYRVHKGFLAQAKLVRKGWRMPRGEYRRTAGQCAKMLGFSRDSFLFLYTPRGVWVASAKAVVANSGQELDGLFTRSLGTFFALHFGSYVGDKNISAPNPFALEDLVRRADVTRALELRLSEGPPAETVRMNVTRSDTQPSLETERERPKTVLEL